MAFAPFLDRTWYGNSFRAWLVAAAIAVGFLLVTLGLRSFIARHLEKVASRTDNPYDDLLLELVRRTRAYFLLFLGILFGSRGLVFPSSVSDALDKATMVVALLQAGVWGNGIIRFWVDRYVAQRAASAEPASMATIRALGYLGRFVVWALLIVTALDSLGFKVSALVTGLGVGGIAVALAVQNVLGDLLAAMAIVFDKPFVVGDTIQVDTFTGTVEHIGLKTTRLRSVGGEQLIFSNAELLKSRIRNYKRMVERRVAFFTDLTYDTAPDVAAQVPQVIREIVEQQPGVRFDRSHFATFAESALRFETVYFVLDPDYRRMMDTQQAINLALLSKFSEQGIRFAFPSRTVYHVGAAAGGSAEG